MQITCQSSAVQVVTPHNKSRSWAPYYLYMLVVSNIVDFNPYLGGNDPIWLINIFQMGWNHQLV